MNTQNKHLLFCALFSPPPCVLFVFVLCLYVCVYVVHMCASVNDGDAVRSFS